jgi:hypothetical protein
MKIFNEEQRFTQLWLHILLIVSFIVPLILIVKEFIDGDGKDQGTLVNLVIVISSMVLVYGLIFSLKLITRIDETGIQLKFIPFRFKNRVIRWEEIEKAYVRNYDAIREFGGWGMKGGVLWRKKRGIAYNVHGDIGLQLELKNGKKILIGTQKQEEMKRLLQTYNSKFVNSIE